MSAAQTRPPDIIIDDFRAIFRILASSDGNKGFSSIVHETYDKYLTTDAKDGKAYLTIEGFELGSLGMKSIRSKFSKEDIQDVFDECDSSQSGKITIDELIDFLQKSISKARVLALKARSAVIQEFHGNESDYRRLFSSLCAKDSVFADKVPFIEFIEDMLEMHISDNDGLAIYGLYDSDGDGKVSVDDFLNFIVGQSPEAARALESQNLQTIVDMKISTSALQDADFMRTGYEQLLPTSDAWRSLSNGASNVAQQGSFGKNQSIWIWRKKQGTCCGRLRPIIDIQVDASATSSGLVLSGYTCIPHQIAGQWLWIKRAFTYEEENDAISDLYVSLGHMKNPGDRIWTSPGIGWIRVDGNFAKAAMFSSFDAFLWFRPIKARSLDIHMSSPIRSVVGLAEDVRLARISVAVRAAVRYYIPVNEMKKLTSSATSTVAVVSVQPNLSPSIPAAGGGGGATTASISNNVPKMAPEIGTQNGPSFDYAALYNQYDRSSKGMLSQSQFLKLLLEIGIRLDSSDVGRIFRFLDVSSNGSIERDEFAFMLKLSDYEIDLVIDHIRNKLLTLTYRTTMTKSNTSTDSPSVSTQLSMNHGTIISPTPLETIGNNNKIRESKTLSSIFRLINRKADGILSLNELLDFLWHNLNVYVTEEEGIQVMKEMDMDGDDRIEEKDFIGFMKKGSSITNEVVIKKAQRLHLVTGTFRRWLQRGGANVKPLAQDQQWVQRHEYVMRSKFPGFLSAPDMIFATAKLGVHLSFYEAREVILLVSPERAGRVHTEDLTRFVKSTCRTFGELLAILSKESTYLKLVVDAYKKYRDAYRTEGFDDRELAEKYYSVSRDIMKKIQGESSGITVSAATAAATKHNDSSKLDIVSISQLKNGFESRADATLNSQAIMNLEEWAALACLAGADVADEDNHGVKVKEFIDNLVKLIVSGGLTSIGVNSNNTNNLLTEVVDEKTTLDILCKDLQRMIYEEAKSAGAMNQKSSNNNNSYNDRGGRKYSNSSKSRPDYFAAFQLFDETNTGSITSEDFRRILIRLQLVENVSDHILSLLVAKFDKKKKGHITYDDFLGFVEAHKDLLDDDEFIENDDVRDRFDDMDSSNLDDDLAVYGLTTQSPPVVITHSPDCDWFMWYLWRQACKLDPSDPESVITELEAACAETEEISQSKGNINSYELWDLLHEMKLVTGALTKGQYESGIAYLLMDGPTKGKKNTGPRYDTDHSDNNSSSGEEVDYEALCRYIVRMGRAFNAKVQEQIKADDKLYKELKVQLRQELLADAEQNSMNGIDKNGNKISFMPKYEKVFRRLDTDGDGSINMQEFKVGLKKLKHKSEKLWTMKMIRRLFNDLDKNHDGSLSVKEITSFLREGDNNSYIGSNSNYNNNNSSILSHREYDRETSGDTINDDYEDEDDMLFVKQKIISDSELFRKVNQILQDLVPLAPRSNPSDHMETVKDAVRRFFQRADTNNRGVVPEERFRAFLRKSSLQDRLSAGEIRKVTDKLRRKKPYGNDRSGGKEGRYMIDYERFIRLIGNIQVSHPLSKAEGVMLRLQSAVNDSARSGRPFLSLCSLIDTQLTGQLSSSELIHTAKMMGCILIQEDIDAMKELLPRTAVGRHVDSGEEMIDYKELLYALQNYVPKYETSQNFDFESSLNQSFGRNVSLGSRSGITQPFDFSRQISGGSNLSVGSGFGGGIHTPLGLTISDHPNSFINDSGNSNSSNRLGNSMINPLLGSTIRSSRSGGFGTRGQNVMVYDKILRIIADRLSIAVDEISFKQSTKYSLRLQFEYADKRREGLITVRDFQSILDDLGVPLSTSELQAVQASFGRPEDNRIDYESFFEAYMPQYISHNSLYRSSSRDQLRLNSGGGGGGSGVIDALNPQSIGGMLTYSHPRVIERWRMLRGEGKDPRSYFATYDFDRLGMIDRQKFREVVQKLQLLQTEYQLTKAMEDFKSVHDPNQIMYEDFCYSIEVLVDNTPGDQAPYGNKRYVDGDGYNGLSAHRPLSGGGSGGIGSSLNRSRGYGDITVDENERWKDAYDNLNKFRSSQGFDSNSMNNNSLNRSSEFDRSNRGLRESIGSRGYPIDLDDDSDNIWNNNRSIEGNQDLSATLRGSYSKGSYPRGSHSKGNLLAPPRSSPSKVGSRIWGSHTSIDKKGKAPKVDDSTWCCAVCMYVENPIKSSVCLICNSPDYSVMKDFQLKEQCISCTFLNGQFAEECEMCGEPLSRSTRSKR